MVDDWVEGWMVGRTDERNGNETSCRNCEQVHKNIPFLLLREPVAVSEIKIHSLFSLKTIVLMVSYMSMDATKVKCDDRIETTCF
jgi:hypothetical protein